MSVFCEIIQLPAISGGGPTQDFIIPGFGTPKAAIFIVTASTSSGVFDDQAKLSFGFTDGSSERSCSVRSEDNVGTSNTSSSMGRNNLIDIIASSSNTLEGNADFDSWITDGVRIKWFNLPTGEYLVTCILFNGSHLSAHVSDYRSRLTADDVCIVSRLQGTITAIGAFGGGVTRITVAGTPFSPTDEGNLFVFDSSNKKFIIQTYVSSSQVDLQGNASAQSPTSTFVFDGPPFVPDVLIAISRRKLLGGSITNDSLFSLGFAKRDTTIVNVSTNWFSDDAKSAGDPRVYVSSDSLIHDVFFASARIEITDFNSNGFDSTTRGTPNWGISYLAIAFGGVADVNTWIFDTPTTSGLFTDNGSNIKPKFVMYGMSHAESVDSIIVDNSAGSLGISAFTPSGEHSHAITDEDASTTMNAASLTNNQAVLLPQDDQTDGLAANYNSMEDTGPELNWSGVMPTSRKFTAFAFSASVNIQASGDLFISGKDTVNTSGNLFVHGLDNIQVSGDLFVQGVDDVSTSGDLYIQGLDTIQASGDLFISGQNQSNSFLDLFIKGREQFRTFDIQQEIFVWGDDSFDQVTNVPLLHNDPVDISAGGWHVLCLKNDGSIIGWGRNSNGQLTVPLPNINFIKVVAGQHHSLGLKNDGTIIAWGLNNFGQLNVPSPNSNFIDIAAGNSHSLGLKSDGSIISWGNNNLGQLDVPAPNNDFISIFCGQFYSIGLKSNGSGVAFGENNLGQTDIPSPNSNFVSFGCGDNHAIGLKNNGSIIGWGTDANGQIDVPSPNADFFIIDAGMNFSVGIKVIDTSPNLFIDGHIPHSASGDLFAQGHDTIFASGDLFIEGLDTIKVSGNLFVQGIDVTTISTNLFVEGHTSSSGSNDLFMIGNELIKSRYRLSSPAFGNEFEFVSSGSVTDNSVARIDTNRFIIAYVDQDGNGQAKIATVSGIDISFGAAYQFETFEGFTSDVKIEKLTDDKFIITYMSIDNEAYGRIATVSGSVISYGDAKQITNIFQGVRRIDMAVIKDTRFILVYQEINSKQPGIEVYDVSGTTITQFFQFETFSSPNTSSSDFRLTTFSDTKFVVVFRDGTDNGHGTAIVGTVSGIEISFGSEYEFSSSGITTNISIIKISDTKFVVAYQDDSDGNNGKAKVGTLNGNVITFGTESNYSDSSQFTSLSTWSGNNFIIAYKDSANLSVDIAKVGFVEDTNISFGSESQFATSGDFIDIAMLSEFEFAIVYQDNSDAGHGTVILANNIPDGDLFTIGHETINESKDLFTKGLVTTEISFDLFIGGLDTLRISGDLFIHGLNNFNFSSDLFIGSKDNVNNSMDLFMRGLYFDSASGDLYILGDMEQSEQMNLFVRGISSGILLASGLTALFINGFEPIPTLSCPVLDPTASIQINDSLIKIYQGGIDALINQLGKNIRLIFDPIIDPCPNCLYDTLRKRSTGIYRNGGPRPFKRGRKCPYCKGRGLLETSVEKCIKCLVKWNPRELKKYDISVENKKGVVRLKTYLTLIDDIVGANTAIIDYDNVDVVKLTVIKIKGPTPVGLREDRYCISFWELV